MTAYRPKTHPAKSIANVIPASYLVATVASLVFAWSGVHSPVVFADAPAVTDFGQDTATPTMTTSRHDARAMFVTFYADGRQQWEIRQVRGDAIVSFAGEHPVWRLDHGLMWFVHMPVYVREVGGQDGRLLTPSV